MKYKVLSPIHHNQKAYEEGEEIELSPEEAEPLQLLHVIEKVDRKSPAKEAN